jgi:hypothetical protein
MADKILLSAVIFDSLRDYKGEQKHLSFDLPFIPYGPLPQGLVTLRKDGVVKTDPLRHRVRCARGEL